MSSLIDDLKMKGFSVQKNVISGVDLEVINKYFDEVKGEFKPAGVGKSQDIKRVIEIRGDYSLWIDPLNPPDPLKGLVNKLNKLMLELNQALYLGLKQYECHLAYYPTGTFYKRHLDRHQGESTRHFTFIFYLNEHWNPGDGGELKIYNKQNELVEIISPEGGTFVGFIPDDFPHEVLEAKKERRTFTGWMHNRIIY